MFDVKKIKENFPIFENYKRETGGELVFLDSAASSQTPKQVVEAMDDYYFKYRSNVHRSDYKIGEEATSQYEKARNTVADFINADKEEIIFTGGATSSSNILTYAIESMLSWGPEDNVVTSIAEHHSNLVPLQELARRNKIKLRHFDIGNEFRLDLSNIDKLIDKNTRLVSIALVSNVLGTIHEIDSIVKKVREVGALLVLDATKAVGHMKIDVKEIDCDFLYFSGHKMCGPTGIGVLYGKKDILEKMPPSFFGGGMVEHVTMEVAKYANSPTRFEPGTPNIAGAIGLSAAVDYLNSIIGMDKIRSHSQGLVAYAIKKLSSIPGVKTLCEADPALNIGIVSFVVEGIHPHDISEILNREHIAVRGGHHCAMPLMGELGVSSVSRASFYIYNQESDIDKLAEGIEKAREIFSYSLVSKK